MSFVAIKIATQLAKILSRSRICLINKTYGSLSHQARSVNSRGTDFLSKMVFNLKTLLPETFIFSFFLVSRVSDLVFDPDFMFGL